MKQLALTLCFTMALIVSSAWAGPYEDGLAAYERGDYETAVKILRSIAEGGNAGAQATLALMYDVGHGVQQNSAEAVKWYRLAAIQGDKSASYNLGSMYDVGVGVAEDKVRAYMWYALSVAAGNESATYERDAVAKKMTPQQLSEAQNLVHECPLRQFKGCD